MLDEQGKKERAKQMAKCRKRAHARLAQAFKAEYRTFLREEYSRAGISARGYESAAERRAKEIAALKQRLAALESAAS